MNELFTIQVHDYSLALKDLEQPSEATIAEIVKIFKEHQHLEAKNVALPIPGKDNRLFTTATRHGNPH